MDRFFKSIDFINLFLWSIFLLLIRFYLASALGIPAYNRAFLILPFITLSLFVISATNNFREILQEIRSNYIYSLSIIIPFFHAFFSFLVFKAPISKFIIYGLPVTYFPIFCVLISFLLRGGEDNQEKFSYFFISIIWICGLLICAEFLLQRWDLLPSAVLQNYLVATPIFDGLGTSVNSISSSRLGPLVLSSTSASLMVLSTCYLFVRTLNLYSQKKKNLQKILFLSVSSILGAISVIQMDSITSVAAMLMTCSLAFFSFVRESEKSKYLFSGGLVVVLFLTVIFYNSRTYERIVKYATIEKEMVSRSIPSFKDCSLLKSLWVKDFGTSNGCDLGEVHLPKKALSSVGIIPMLPWLVWFFLPLFILLRRRNWSQDFKRPDFLGVISIYLCSLHYSPAESWGINFIFFLLVSNYSFSQINVRVK